MSKGGRCKGWKLEGGWREGWCWAEEAPGRGRVREPRQRSFSKSPTARGMHRGASLQRGLCFSLKPGPPAPKIRRATPLGSVTSSAALTVRAYVRGRSPAVASWGPHQRSGSYKDGKRKESLTVPTAPTLFQGAAECGGPGPRVSPQFGLQVIVLSWGPL